MKRKRIPFRLLSPSDCLLVDLKPEERGERGLRSAIARAWPGDGSELLALRLSPRQALLVRRDRVEGTVPAASSVYALPSLGPPPADPSLRLHLREGRGQGEEGGEASALEWARFSGGLWSMGEGPLDGACAGFPPAEGGYASLDCLCSPRLMPVLLSRLAGSARPGAAIRRRSPGKPLSPFARPIPTAERRRDISRLRGLALLCAALLLMAAALGRLSLVLSLAALERSAILPPWRRECALALSREGDDALTAGVLRPFSLLASALASGKSAALALEEAQAAEGGFSCSGSCPDALALCRRLSQAPGIRSAELSSLSSDGGMESFLIKGYFDE